MQRAKVQQKSEVIRERPEDSSNRNWFSGLSHDWVATFTMGKLVPFLMLFTLPHDFFKIRAEVMMRFAPLYLPIMHRVNLSLDYFFVPFRILWKDNAGELNNNWEYFIMGKDGILNPYVEFQAYVIDEFDNAGELAQYMGAPTLFTGGVTGITVIPINALPLAAYYMIYDQYYRNDQIQTEILAEDDVVGGNVSETLFTKAPASTLRCCYRNWNRDLFTSCTPEPQMGAPVQIPLVDDGFTSAISGTAYEGPYSWRRLDGTGASGALSASSAGGDPGRTLDGGAALVYLDIQETAASIAQFRFATVYQEFLERAMRTGDKISDYYPAFWNTDPYNGTIQLPQFLGAKNGKVIISEVMSTAETVTLKVGNYAGQALALESTNDTLEYHCLEHGVILGIVSVYPDSSYMQGLAREWSYLTYLDYPDPRFALIGDEEVKYKEVQFDFDATTQVRNDETFGYRERYLDSRFKNDVVAGDMRETLKSFHLARIFPQADADNPVTGSVLNGEFLLCKPRVTDVFQVTTEEDEIYCHIFNDIKVQRMLPKFGIPAL